MARADVLLLVALMCLATVSAFGFHPAPQFTTDFKVWAQYNASFSFNNRNSPEPFLWTPPVSPLAGKLYFDWVKQGFRVELQGGPGAPWDLKTTVIINPTNMVKGPNSFNVTWNVYEYLSDGRCWWYKWSRVNQPYNLDGFSNNVVWKSFGTVDGFTCGIFQDTVTLNIYAIRMEDMAVIQVRVPYDGWIPVPIFQILGGAGNSSSWIDMYNPALGAIDPSKYAVPTGQCIYVQDGVHSDSIIPNLISYKTVATDLNPLKFFADVAKESLKKGDNVDRVLPLAKRQRSPPRLAQQFTADIVLTINATTEPPYKQYTITGKVAFDFVNFGAYIMWDGISGAIPFDLKTGLIAHPGNNGVEFLIADPEGDCWSIIYFQWLWTYLLPPFQIPHDAAYVGEAVINGDKCSIWNYWWGYRSVTIFVRESDGALVKGLHFDDPTWTNQGGNWVLKNLKMSVDPSIYARPASCVETMTWNPSFQSHLPWYWCDPFCGFMDPLRDAARNVAAKFFD